MLHLCYGELIILFRYLSISLGLSCNFQAWQLPLLLSFTVRSFCQSVLAPVNLFFHPLHLINNSFHLNDSFQPKDSFHPNNPFNINDSFHFPLPLRPILPPMTHSNPMTHSIPTTDFIQTTQFQPKKPFYPNYPCHLKISSNPIDPYHFNDSFYSQRPISFK